MSDSTEPLREQASTYIVQDRSNQEEMVRLEILDKMLTSVMGGVLPELPNPTRLRRVLDVGCGTGGWLMEAARIYPTIEKLVGVDINSKMMAYARVQARDLALGERVQFQTMDALRILEFPNATFDLVNQRMGTSWLRTWEWTKLLSEYRRVTRSDGIIRITESSLSAESNSPALTKLWDICLQALYRSGRLFTANSEGVIGQLANLMKQHGIRNIQTHACRPVYRVGTVEGDFFYEDMRHTFRLFLPFFHKWTRVPSDYEEIYQQALKEMQQPDFAATGTLLTVWGTK
jgi:ubiquinone/menaquinone biosynthesis C-methylase UbiE